MSNPKFRKLVVYAMIAAMVLSSVMMGISMFF